MTITSYFGLKPCCDCGRTGNYTVSKNGYQFTVCSDCVHDYSDEEEEENDNSQKQDEEFERETKEFEREVEREKARILRNLLRYFGGTK